MTSEIEPEHELAQILETTVSKLRDAGLTPTDTDIEYYDNELWGYIWLAETPVDTITHRKQTATKILRNQINTDAHVLPTTVNINCGDVGDYGIAVWWN